MKKSWGYVLVVCSVLSLTGCDEPTVGCSDDETVALARQIFAENVDLRVRYREPDRDKRAAELADVMITMSDIVTRRRMTADNPTTMCEATIKVDAYSVDIDLKEIDKIMKEAEEARFDEQGNQIPEQEWLDARHKRLNSYSDDPANLIRKERSSRVFNVTYTAAFTDDGRIQVELAVEN